MSKQTGDFRLKVALAGEPATVRSACNEGSFSPREAGYDQASSATDLRTMSQPRIVEAGAMHGTFKADAESVLSSVRWAFLTMKSDCTAVIAPN